MEYKISEVVAKTNVPKSTILYYIKEGLLPEAKKIKPNVHKYSDEHIELLKYIKYMQSMGHSIEDIKLALENKNNSFSGSYSMLVPLMNTLRSDVGLERYSYDEFIEYFDINKTILDTLLQDEIIIPIHNEFTQKDAAIFTLIEHFLEVGIEYKILQEYVASAKHLASLEQQMQKQLCKAKNEENFTTLWQIMFETLFNAKEYIFNRFTYKVLIKSLQEELSPQKD